MNSLKDPNNMALKVMVMPNELNHHGTAFGGTILAYLDQAGATIASEYARCKVVLVNMKEAQFITPIFVNDRIHFYGRVKKAGRTSITVEVEYWRNNVLTGAEKKAGHAEIVYVAVNDELGPRPIRPDTPQE